MDAAGISRTASMHLAPSSLCAISAPTSCLAGCLLHSALGGPLSGSGLLGSGPFGCFLCCFLGGPFRGLLGGFLGRRTLCRGLACCFACGLSYGLFSRFTCSFTHGFLCGCLSHGFPDCLLRGFFCRGFTRRLFGGFLCSSFLCRGHGLPHVDEPSLHRAAVGVRIMPFVYLTS
jgi:hypothetical protein